MKLEGSVVISRFTGQDSDGNSICLTVRDMESSTQFEVRMTLENFATAVTGLDSECVIDFPKDCKFGTKLEVKRVVIPYIKSAFKADFRPQFERSDAFNSLVMLGWEADEDDITNCNHRNFKGNGYEVVFRRWVK